VNNALRRGDRTGEQKLLCLWLDLPGCVATGASLKDVEREIRDAIRFHIEGLKEDGLPVPAPTSIAEYVEASGSAEAWPVSLIIADPALVLPQRRQGRRSPPLHVTMIRRSSIGLTFISYPHLLPN